MENLRDGVAPAARSLRETWRAASVDSVWLRPGDWYHPAVDAIVEALCEGRSTIPASERLGTARGEAGISIGETIDDLTCLFRTRDDEPTIADLRAVSTGWVVGNEWAPLVPGTCDPESGLATSQYLVQRLRETYGIAARQGALVSRTHCLVVIDVAVEQLSGWQRTARSAAMGKTLTDFFGEGHPIATLGDGTFAVLSEREAATDALRSEIRQRIEHAALCMGVTAVLRRPPRIWIEALPSTHEAAVHLVGYLQR